MVIGAAIGFVITALSSLPYFYMRVELGKVGDALGAVIAVLYLPGLFCAMALSGNVHGGSLQVAFLLNFIFYGALSYGLLRWRTSRAK
jgi:hypothetical protein